MTKGQAKKTTLNASDLQIHFEAGLVEFEAKLASISEAEQIKLMDLLQNVSESIVSARS